LSFCLFPFVFVFFLLPTRASRPSSYSPIERLKLRHCSRERERESSEQEPTRRKIRKTMRELFLPFSLWERPDA